MSGALGVLYQFDNGLSPHASFAQSFEPVIGDNGNGQPLVPQEGEQVEVEAQLQLGAVSVEFNASRIDTQSATGYQFDSVPEKQASTWVTAITKAVVWRAVTALSAISARSWGGWVIDSN